MINYNENVNINDDIVLENIVNRKYDPGRQLLLNCINLIKEDYSIYKENKTTLELINPDSRIGLEEGKLLIDTYNSNPKDLRLTKEVIKSGLPSIVKAKCPYCMISAHSTFDHYLDKSSYPEYALFSLNLIPACAECNSRKGSSFLDESGERIFINFLYDILPDYPFLKYEIGFADGKPYLMGIHLEFERVQPINKIIERHFRKLNLYERLEVQFENTVSTIIAEFKEYALDRTTVENVLKKKINAMEKNKGINNWEVCIMRGILENQELLDDISS